MTKATNRLWPRLALVLASLIWGIAFVVMKSALDTMPPLLLLALRFTIAALVLGLCLLKRLKRGLNPRLLRRGLGCGLILGAAYIIQALGLQETTAGKNAFLTAVYCVLVPFVAWVWMKRRPGVNSFIAALLCLLGIGLISLSEADGRAAITQGDALSLLCGVIFAVQVTSLSRYGREEDPLLMTLLQFVSAAALCWTGALIRRESLPALTWPMAWELGYLSILSTCLALLLQNIGQAGTPPAPAGILLSLESVFAVISAVLFMGEKVTPRLAVGFAVVFVAVGVSSWAGGREGKG
ncbi:MAG: DMT family transporter [Clostridia bacterium]|nr:DMT family transporter [Clostridia bacterium]